MKRPAFLPACAGPAFASLLLLAAGGLIAWTAAQAHSRARAELAAARADLERGRALLARIAGEGQGLQDRIELYRSLQARRVLGEERRLDWVEAIDRIRAARGLLQLHYRIEPRRRLGEPSAAAPVDAHASLLKLRLALLHEEDLVGFLRDFRRSGGAHHAVRRCEIARGDLPAASGAPAARLRAECEIELITLVERGAGMKILPSPGSEGAPAAAGDAPGPELGRIFFTPAERAALDAGRRLRPAAAGAVPASARRTRIDGYVVSAQGPATLWLNGVAHHDEIDTGEVRAERDPATPGRIELRGGAARASVELGAGDVYDPARGTVQGLLGEGELRIHRPARVQP